MLSKIGFSLFVVLAVVAFVIGSQPMHIGRAASGCQVTYTPNQWNNGFTAEVKITNNNTTAISGWTLTWSFANGQQITGAWNATVTQSGANVSASVPAGNWNGTIGANGGSATFGFQATHTGTNAVPNDFVLNGVACNQQDVSTPTPTVAVHPDLVVSGIRYESGVVGVCTIPANQGVVVAVRNTGNADAGAFVVTLNTTWSATVSGLAMGAETMVFFPGYNPGNVTAVVDPADLIDEISEDNNQRNANLPVPTGYPPACTPTPTPTGDARPDLIVSSIVYAPGTPSGCATPPDMGTRVFIRNMGLANAGAFVVTLNNTLSANLSGLAAGAETSVLFAQNVMQNTAIVDPNNVIFESNETNNQLTATLPIPTQAPTCTPTPTDTCTNTIIQAESASRGGGAAVNSNNAGYTGTGFINFPANGGYIQFTGVNGGSGGSATLRIRYALASGSRTGQLAVNGATQSITFTSTGSWSTWLVRDVNISLNAGATNTIRFQSTGQDLANIDQIEVVVCGSVVTITPTPTPTPTTPLPCGTLAPGATPVPGCLPVTPMTPTPTATTPPGTVYTGNATYFDALGMPYGGCGITQSALDSQNFVALNVQNTPGDYSTMFSRPIAAQYADKIGMFNNGLNCGRWVRVTISDFCNGINDGAPGKGFCHDGTGWVADAYNGATLDMIVADSCQDSNGWCRDDPYHLDLAKASLNLFVKNGQPIGDMYPNHWNNRKITWQFIEAPNYTGDITIAFIKDAQVWWTPIAITHLRNGIHGVDYYENGAWVKATMNADMGQTYLIRPTTSGGTTYRIRVYDVNDQPINNGRIYNFSFPASCGTQCSSEFTPVTYTVE